MRGSGCAEDLVGRLEDFARLAQGAGAWDFLCVAPLNEKVLVL